MPYIIASFTYRYVCSALCSSSFSAKKAESSSFCAEKAESGEIAAQQILARVAIRVCMCVPIGENNVRVACCGACSWPRSTDYEPSPRAYFKAGAIPASLHDFLPRGVLNTRIWRRGPARSLRSYVLCIRGFYSAPPCLNVGKWPWALAKETRQ